MFGFDIFSHQLVFFFTFQLQVLEFAFLEFDVVLLAGICLSTFSCLGHAYSVIFASSIASSFSLSPLGIVSFYVF